MKKIVAIAVVAILCLGVCSCSSGSPSEVSVQPSESATETSTPKETQTKKPKEKASPSSATTAPTPKPLTDLSLDLNVQYAAPFHDGVAWVRTSPVDEPTIIDFIDNTDAAKVQALASYLTTSWYCIDKTGNVLFKLDQGQKPETRFAKGVARLENGDLIDKTGSVIWSLKTDGEAKKAELGNPGDVEDPVILVSGFASSIDDEVDTDFNGYTMVQYSVYSYDYTGNLVGIIGPNGEWVFGPTDAFGDSSYSLTDGDIISSDMKGCYYNVATGEYVDESQPYDSESFDPDAGPWTSTASEWEDEQYFRDHDGLEFDGNGFVDSSGAQRIDLSRYTFSRYGTSPVFNDGYAFLVVTGKDGGGLYYTVIDTQGQEMFPPRPFGNQDLFDRRSISEVYGAGINEGRIWVYGKERAGYIDQFGNYLFDDLDLDSGGVFHEGMAAAAIEGDLCYITVDGEVIKPRIKLNAKGELVQPTPAAESTTEPSNAKRSTADPKQYAQTKPAPTQATPVPAVATGGFDSNGFVFADSSERYLSMDELMALSKEMLGFARNEIFARNGNLFRKDKYIDHYGLYSWYQSLPNKRYDVNPEDLNEIERANIALIQEREAQLG